MTLKIEGILAVPQISRNKAFYFPQELAKGNGMTVPLRWEHIKENGGIIGESTLTWDEARLQLTYKALVNNPAVEELLRKQKFQTSLGIEAADVGKICHKDGMCFEAPMDVKFKEMSIVEFDNAGIPASTVTLVEGLAFIDESVKTFVECQACGADLVEDKHGKITDCPPAQQDIDGNCKPVPVNKGMNTSNSTTEDKDKLMTETKPIKKEDTTVSVKTDDKNVPAPAPATAPAPIPTAPAPATAPAPTPEPTPQPTPAPIAPTAPAVEAPKTEAPCEPGCTPVAKPPVPPAPSEQSEEVKKLVEDALKIRVEELQKEIRENYQPKATVAESNAIWTEAKAEEHANLMKEVLDGKSISIMIDKDEFIKQHTASIKGVFDEAITTSGTIPGVDVGTQIVILPGGIKIKPIRQWVEVRKIPQGDDTVRFYTLDIPAFGNITESATTDITPATHTLTSIDLAANTVRGFRQNVLKSELERYPKQLLEKIRETARIRAIEDEANNILNTTAAATTADFGANHLGGDDGALVVDETDEDAAAEFRKEGIEAGRQRLEEQGHNVDGGSIVCAITPRAVRQLHSDPDINRYVQVGAPSISRTGRLEMYLGVELFVTNTINVSNNSDRNIMWAKGKAFGLAIGRDIELEFDKNINRQSVDVVATHRVNSVILDATAYCILSSKSD